MIEIKYATNGWYIVDADEGVTLFQDDDCAIEAFADLLAYVASNYGPSTGRYSEKRIQVGIKPGDKYEDSLEEMTIDA